MEKLKMDEERVIYLLRNKKTLMDNYNRREAQLLSGLESYSETIEGVSFKSKEIKEFVLSRTNSPADPIFSLIEKIERERETMAYEALEGLLNVIWLQYELSTLLRELDTLDEPYRSILERLYINRDTWDETEFILGIATSTLKRKRKQAMKLLVDNTNRALKKQEVQEHGKEQT